MSHCLSIYAFSPRLLLDGKSLPFHADQPLMQPVLYRGAVIAPAVLFGFWPDTEVSLDDASVVIHHAGQRYDWTDVAHLERGYACLPAVQCAEAMGISARQFGQMVVFADAAQLDELSQNEEALQALRRKTCGIYNAAYFTAEDFKIARDCWRRNLCGDAFTNDPSVPGMANLLKMRDMDSDMLRHTMHREADMVILWGDQPPRASADLKLMYDRILRMAQPFGTIGCRGYHSPELLKDIVFAMDWMHDHMYGAQLLSDSSYRSYKIFNWWEWLVGGGYPMINIVMIIEAFIPKEQMEKYVLPLAFIRTQMRVGLHPDFAMSRILPLTPLALLTEDRALLQSLYLDVVMLFADIPADYCDLTHGMPYNVTYGQNYLSRLGMIMRVLKPSPLAFPIPECYELMQLARYCFATCLYRGQGLSMMNGRYMQENAGAPSALQMLSSFHELFGLFGEEEDRELFEIIHRNATPEVKAGLISTYDTDISPEQYLRINTTKAHPQVPKTHIASYASYYKALTDPQFASKPTDIAHMWYTGDSCVQFQNGHLIALRMNSKRTMSYESINGANGDGWYTGDGMLYLYTPGDATQYTPAWWKGVDKHLMPGTTVQERQRESMFIDRGYFSHQDFVGGISLDKRFICASMDLESFHNEVDEGRPDTGYGRSMPVHLCTLTAQKSYFLFDKAVVALGTKVDSKDGYAVRTVVEHRMLPNGIDGVLINGEQLVETHFTRDDIRSIYLPHVGGFFFPVGGVLTLRVYESEGSLFITFYLEHGVDPEDGHYAYIILPNASAQEAAQYDPSDIEWLQSDARIHAVRQRSSGLTGIVFREAGTVGRYIAHQPMILLAREDEHALRLSACDPTQLRESIDYEVDGRPVHIACASSRGRGYDTIFEA